MWVVLMGKFMLLILNNIFSSAEEEYSFFDDFVNIKSSYILNFWFLKFLNKLQVKIARFFLFSS